MSRDTSSPPVEVPVPESLVNLTSLRECEDVPTQIDSEVADREQVEQVAELDNMAIAGVTDEEGRTLFRRETADCAWKLPVGSVASGADYVSAARRALDATGVDASLTSIEGVWGVDLTTADGAHAATRRFVVFAADLDGDGAGSGTLDPERRTVHEAGWFTDLPDDGAALPGTDLFLDGSLDAE